MLLLGTSLQWTAFPASAVISNIVGPAGSGRFGSTVAVLPNGNIVIADPYYDSSTASDTGAVYLYNGANGALISTLTGSQANDMIGVGVVVLKNGNYVILSPGWDNDSTSNAGAITWGSKTSGVSGQVSPGNSLVGTHANDQIGMGATALTNGNYVSSSITWDNGSTTDAGAVTWGNGSLGTYGAVTVSNSLVGSHTNDQVGSSVAPLNNGNYVVMSINWNNGSISEAGAATWGNGNGGTTGPVLVSNSLVGSQPYDHIGYDVRPLSNGNYVVFSPDWDKGTTTEAGAAAWGDGSLGTSGVVTTTNSLYGSHSGDMVGFVTALSNGNYVVTSALWDNGATMDVGAATWGNGASGTNGEVSTANSLVGSQDDDTVGSYGAVALSNGNYVVVSPYWNNGATTDTGAVTWRNGNSMTNGTVSAANSLVGTHTNDNVGLIVTALSNGNYVVGSNLWDNGLMADAGAATWGNGSGGTTGPVSIANSLYGNQANEQTGFYVTALTNGNYVVISLWWDNGGIIDVGAATWVTGTGVTSGSVSASNSLVGSQTNDLVGGYGVVALSDGNYVVVSPTWINGATTFAGAVTWGNGNGGTTGVVTVTNSLVGSHTDDTVGSGDTFNPGVIALSDNLFAVRSPYWNNGATDDSGAVSWCFGNQGTVGTINWNNSVLGTAPDGGQAMLMAFDSVNYQLVVGRPMDNIVTIFRPYGLYLPSVKK